MRKFAISCVAGLSVAIATVLVACGPSKPTGAEYLGKWAITTHIETYSFGCVLEISKTGESFLTRNVTKDRSHAPLCDRYEGIYTLSPEGNLVAGGKQMSLVKSTNEVEVTGVSGMEPMKRVQ